MKHIKTFEKIFKNPDIFKQGDIIKFVKISKNTKEKGINVKKGDLAEIIDIDENDNVYPFRIVPLNYKNKIVNYWNHEFWVKIKDITRAEQFEIDMIKYNL